MKVWEWVPLSTLVELLCWDAQQPRATQRAWGRGRYVGAGWLRTHLLEVKTIC